MVAVKEYQQDPYKIHKIWYLVNATKHTYTLVKQEYSWIYVNGIRKTSAIQWHANKTGHYPLTLYVQHILLE